MLLEKIVFGITFFIYGIVIGSFTNVCIYRIPQKENIAKERSHCMACNHTLAWHDLFPLFSWLFLKGKCRYCGAKISKQYPIVEFINGAFYVWIYLVFGLSIETILYCFLLSALVTLSVIDWRTFEIPLGINIFILCLGIIGTLADLEHLADHLIGLVCVSGFLAILYYATKGRGIGGGDVRLMGAAGLLAGWQKILLALVLGAILGSVIHIIRMRVEGQEHALAFGPYLSAGIMIAVLYGTPLISWYTGMFFVQN